MQVNKVFKSLIWTVVIVSLTVYGQDIQYESIADIHYYPEKVRQGDGYIDERCVLDIYYPKKSEGFATIVWFHGGGLKSWHKEIPEALKEEGFCIVGVNYRLHPHVKSPAYVQDAAAAVSWVFKNIENWGGDPALIFVSGHSAGGYLTSMIGLDKKYMHAHGIDANLIAGLIPFSGHTITHFTIREERGIAGTQPIIDDMAPLYHVRPDAPPLLLITGDREMELLGRYEENAYFKRMMDEVGHQEVTLFELDGYDHGGMVHPAFPLLMKEVRRISALKRTNHSP